MSAPLGDPVAADASLHLLADHLADALAAGELAPCLLHVGGADADGFELGVLPLDGAHPTEVLLGLTAPEHWHAVGLATSGWAYHVAERSDPGRRRRRVHVVSLLSRSGEHAHRTTSDDVDLAARLAGEAPVGEQVDLLRRVLGLATDPPPVDAAAYCTDQAVQLHGGTGYMRGTEVEMHYRDARILGIGGGANEVLDDLAAKLLGYWAESPTRSAR